MAADEREPQGKEPQEVAYTASDPDGLFAGKIGYQGFPADDPDGVSAYLERGGGVGPLIIRSLPEGTEAGTGLPLKWLVPDGYNVDGIWDRTAELFAVRHGRFAIVDKAGGIPLQVAEPDRTQNAAIPGPGVVERPSYTPRKRVFTILDLKGSKLPSTSRQKVGTLAQGERPGRRTGLRSSSQR